MNQQRIVPAAALQYCSLSLTLFKCNMCGKTFSSYDASKHMKKPAATVFLASLMGLGWDTARLGILSHIRHIDTDVNPDFKIQI